MKTGKIKIDLFFDNKNLFVILFNITINKM